MKKTTTQAAMLSKANEAGSIRIGSKGEGNTFASLARAGLMTHSCDGTPEPGFYAYVIGSIVYITPAGRAAL